MLNHGIKMRKISRLFRQEVIVKTDFRVLIFSVFVVFLGAVGLTGCSSQEVYVYEKLPEFSECRRCAVYRSVSFCNHMQQIILSKKLNSAMRTTVYRLNRKYNQRYRCKERNYGPVPVGCYINYLPLHYNLPSFGKIAD